MAHCMARVALLITITIPGRSGASRSITVSYCFTVNLYLSNNVTRSSPVLYLICQPAKQLLKKNVMKIFGMSPKSHYKLADKLWVNPDSYAMDRKPGRILCYVFVSFYGPGCAQHSILNLLTNNRDITLIYSVTICEQIQRVVYGQGASNINYTILVFNFDVCPLSYNQSHLLSMVWTGKLDLNTPHVDVKISKSAKKNLRIQQYLDKCGRIWTGGGP